MKLKELLENDSDEQAQAAREEKQNIEQQEEMAEFDGETVTIFVNGGTVTAIIGFDKSNYVNLSDFEIDDNPEDTEFDFKDIKAKAEKVLNDELSNEVDLEG